MNQQAVALPIVHQGYIPNKSKPPIIDFNEAHRAKKMLLALNKPVAKAILKLLVNNIDKPDLCVTDIFILLRQEQDVVSQHLAKLRSTGIVRYIRAGKAVYYYVVPERVERISNAIKKLSAMIDDTVDIRITRE